MKIMSALIVLLAFPASYSYGQWGQPNPQYQQGYGAPSSSGQIDGACMGRCTGQGGSWAQCQRVCN